MHDVHLGHAYLCTVERLHSMYHPIDSSVNAIEMDVLPES